MELGTMSFETPGDGKRCDHCDQPGKPYTYRGKPFSGLVAYMKERLCPKCLDIAVNGTEAPTKPDAMLSYGIENAEYRNVPLTVKLDGRGHIWSLEVA
jgi:uncharacterized protein CbrC (UPF0167 family)